MNDYSLIAQSVDLETLHLDPSNPRLMGTKDDGPVVPGAWTDAAVQTRLLTLIDQPAFNLDELQTSFIEKGFLNGMQPIIVQRQPGTEMFRVLEGNRRTAALKLLHLKGELPFSKIPIQEFVWNPDCGKSEEEAIELVLTKVHVAGPKGWGAWQIAVYVHKAYARKRREISSDPTPFYMAAVGKEVGKDFQKKPSTVQKLLLVRRAFAQLHKGGFQPSQEHYTLVDHMLSPAFNDFLGIDRENCMLAEPGIDKLGHLVIAEDRPISNEALFRKFRTILTAGGTEADLFLASQSTSGLEEVYDRVQTTKKAQRFEKDLVKVKKLLGGLALFEYQGTEREKKLMREVASLAIDRIGHILRESD